MRKVSYNRFYIIRERDGRLFCSNIKPTRSYNSECKTDYEWTTTGDFFEVDRYMFEQKFTDDPLEVEIKPIIWEVKNC